MSSSFLAFTFQVGKQVGKKLVFQKYSIFIKFQIRKKITQNL